MGFSNPAAIAAGYAAGLLVAAELLDRLARHTHLRSERFRTAGFRYHPEHDSWVCPQDQHLWPHSYDAELRLLRYRAKPSVCNACPVRSDCTSSEHGREIVRAVDPWPHSEAGRFHRGVALVLVVIAALFVMTAAIATRDTASLVLLLAVLVLTVASGWRLSSHLRRTPSTFPDGPPAGFAIEAATAPPTRWASDRRRRGTTTKETW
jgi:hypothetical protein